MRFEIEKNVDSLGRLVLPKAIRDYYKINFGDKVSIIATEYGILLRKKENSECEENCTVKMSSLKL